VRLRRKHGLAVALGISVVLALIDLQWASTLHYRLAQPDFYVYYLAAQLGRAHGWAAIYDPAVFLPPVTAAVGKPLPYLNPPELAWLVTPLSLLPYSVAAWIWTGLLAVAFAVIWYIWWMAIVGLIGAFAIFVWYAWRDEHEHIIPIEEVRANARERRRIRQENLQKLSQSV